jgi:hypothetical protein
LPLKLVVMTDGLTFLNGESAGAVRRTSGYGAPSVREVQARASVTDQQQTEQEKRGLRRLNNILSNDRPLRDNVPRGFHLNIEV